jgi:hypothetical protein
MSGVKYLKENLGILAYPKQYGGGGKTFKIILQYGNIELP